MLAIAGTVPDLDFPLTEGEVTLEQDKLRLNGRPISVQRGTPALLGAVLASAEVLGNTRPYAFLAGDIGLGHGSRKLYEHLTRTLMASDFTVITFHYLQPDVDWHNRVLFATEEMARRPVLIADAGFMYAAKMSGQAPSYDLFTPDVGEMAFLADEEAPHPFYTRGFILHQEDRVPEWIARAYAHDNAARHLLVKGKTDHVVHQGTIVAAVQEPNVETLEPIGGTGDTLTGMVSALAAAGYPITQAATIAARANRLAGFLAQPTPATSVAHIIARIPEALNQVLQEFSRTG